MNREVGEAVTKDEAEAIIQKVIADGRTGPTMEEIVGGEAAATIRTARQLGIPVMLYGGGADLYHALKRESDGPVYCYDLCKERAGTVNGVYLTVFINGC